MNYTPKQLKLLRFLRKYIRKVGCSPTHKEMGAELGINPTTIHEHLGHLERKGAISRRNYEARGVNLTASVPFGATCLPWLSFQPGRLCVEI